MSQTSLRRTAGRLAGAAAIILAAGGPTASAAPEDSAGQIVVPLSEAATLLAIPLAEESPFDQPRQDFPASLPACAEAADVGLAQVFGRPDLRSFHGSLLRDDAEEGRYLVKQAVGVFGSAAAAAQAHGELVTHVASCLKAQGLDNTADAKPGRDWTFTGMNATNSQLAWRKAENRENGWQCGLVGLAQGNALLQALVCERTPPPKGPATELLGAMAARIPQSEAN